MSSFSAFLLINLIYLYIIKKNVYCLVNLQDTLVSNSQKMISIAGLRPGMYVENVYSETGILLFNADFLVEGYHHIEYLKNQGVTTLSININKSSDLNDLQLADMVDEGPAFVIEAADDVLFQYEQKLQSAYTVRQKAVCTIKNIFSDSRAGRIFSIPNMIETIEEMVENVLEDPDVYMRVCQIKEHSYSTYIHSVNVSVLMAGFGAALGLSRQKIIEASIGGLLHDIGKIRIPEHLLRKERVYTRHEMELIRKHPEMGLDVVKRTAPKVPESSFRIILQHHERVNGSGYPNRLKGRQIDDMAMMCAISDIYESLTSGTSFQKSCLPQEALALIFQGAEEEYPRQLVEYFTKMLGIYPVGSFVRLASGEMGLVIKVNRNSLLNPNVVLLFDADGGRIASPFVRDLSKVQNHSDKWKIECSLDPELYKINTNEFISSGLVL